MKRFTLLAGSVLAALGIVAFVGCDWSSNSTDFNTSKGAGLNINWTGTYFGQLPGGRLVSQTSGGPITRLVIQNSGNTLEVTDNNGSRYVGRIGSPGIVSAPSVNPETGEVVYPAGAEIVQAQVTFSGKDEIAAKDIEFVGVIHAVTVNDVRGNTVEDTTTVTDTNTVTIPDDTNTTDVTEREIVTEREVVTGRTTTFEITEANTQYRLQGTWIENGGGRGNVDGLSPGSVGSVTTVDGGATPF